MAPKKDKTMDDKIESLQKDVGKIASIEKNDDEILQRLAKMDVLDRLERRLTAQEERQASTTGNSIQSSDQPHVSQPAGDQTVEPTMEVDRVVEQTRFRSVESELKMPLTQKIINTGV
ncbi:unnamed protein product [Cochlearia groenlandica]